ncbi:MAG TPA: AI-2E family transporter, partial [Mycobacteriales bacterium]|nr:AI-2E family transporter [Mycobacteriales bacterium]
SEQAVDARSGAVAAEHEAKEAAGEAVSAAQAALEALPDDDPLVDPHIHEYAAGADEEHPFGEMGAPVAERSPFRIGFTAALGVLLALVLGRAFQLVSSVLVLIVIAAFLSIGLNPAVEWLMRKGRKRGAAVAVVISAVLLFFVAFVAAAVPPVVSQAANLREELPARVEKLRDDNATFRNLDTRYGLVAKATEAAEKQASSAPRQILGIARGIVTAIFKTLTVLILTLYFLSAHDRIKRGALRIVPRSRRPRVGLLADEILARVGGYVLGNLATSVVAGVICGVFLMVMGVPYALALALLVAILDLIPLVGATIAALVCTLVAVTVSVPVGIATLVFFTIYQQFENYVLVPRVMKKAVDVSPIATIVAALIGGSLLGVLGALLAVPTAAAISLIGSEVLVPRQDAR